MSKQTYEVKSPVKVDGKIVKTGTVECDPKVAAPLLKTGSLIETTGSSSDSEITLEVFSEAVAQLDPDNVNHWTRSGTPDLKALDAAGLKVTGKERDALWAEHLKSQEGGSNG